MAIGIYMLERLAGHAEIGDRVPVGLVELIVRSTDDKGAITAAGLALAPEHAPEVRVWPILRGIFDLAAIVQALLGRLQERLKRGAGDRAPGTRRRRAAPPSASDSTGSGPAG
jgi:cell volume regulation protein A